MKTSKLLTSFAVLMATTLAAFATPTWIALRTVESDADGIEGATDENPSTAEAANYTAYYCTVEAAKKLFGNDTSAGAMTSYLSDDANFQNGQTWFANNGTSFASASYGTTKYSFLSYTASAFDNDDYIAVVFYNNVAFRAFGTDSAKLDSGNIIFNDETAASGTVGDWTAVPEPTSGILLLLGFAGLALRRRNER